MQLPRPWFRKSEKAWYVQLGGKQHRLGRTAKEAEKQFKELLVLDLGPADPKPKAYTFRQLAKLFLRWSKRRHSQETRAWYRHFLKSFCGRFGSRKAHQLKPIHIDHWLDKNPAWGDSTSRSAIISVNRVLNWAVKRKVLKENALKDIEKPEMQRREEVLDGQEHDRVFAAIKDEEFRDFVFAMRETGCRPGEIRNVAAADVSPDFTLWVIKKHKTKKRTGRVRVVYLTPLMQELTKKLTARYPCGPIFRSYRSKKAPEHKGDRSVAGEKLPWTSNAIRQRFSRLRDKLGIKGLVAYVYRHSYTTDALGRGVPAAVLAELQGSSVRMIEKHYSHLTVKADLLRQAAIQAVGAEPAGKA